MRARKLRALPARNGRRHRRDGGGGGEHERAARSNSKEYKARFCSLNFNLRDLKNPTFIRHVMTARSTSTTRRDGRQGHGERERRSSAPHSTSTRRWRRWMTVPSATTRQEYRGRYPMLVQVDEDRAHRGPDALAGEPTTKKCTCNNCEYRWKFC